MVLIVNVLSERRMCSILNLEHRQTSLTCLVWWRIMKSQRLAVRCQVLVKLLDYFESYRHRIKVKYFLLKCMYIILWGLLVPKKW